MKSSSLFLAGLLLVPTFVWSQGPGGRRGETPPAPITPANVPLTPQQVEVITKQLVDLEKQIQEMRGSTLTTVLAKLRSAVASEAAALNFYLDCEKLINVDRKDLDKTEERQRKEQMERQAERRTDKKAEDQEGDIGLATKLHIEYLILCLEAHEAKPADRDKLIPKLQAFIQEAVAGAEKLKGRAGNMLSRDVGGSPIVQAYQIGRYLDNQDHWTNRPLGFGEMWDRAILPHVKEQKADGLAAQWDARINAEGALRKGQMPEPEFVIWTQQELPVLKWQRATYLLHNGPTPVNALKDMLDVIKAYPGHPSAPLWLEEMRLTVTASSGGAAAGSSVQ